jgi:hypothetical protein
VAEVIYLDHSNHPMADTILLHSGIIYKQYSHI